MLVVLLLYILIYLMLPSFLYFNAHTLAAEVCYIHDSVTCHILHVYFFIVPIFATGQF